MSASSLDLRGLRCLNVHELNAALRSNELDYRLLKILETESDISQRELARRLGVSLGKINYCLQALISKGWVKVRNFTNSDHKRAYMYYLTKRGVQEKARVTMEFIKWKMAEFEALRAELENLHRDENLQAVES